MSPIQIPSSTDPFEIAAPGDYLLAANETVPAINFQTGIAADLTVAGTTDQIGALAAADGSSVTVAETGVVTGRIGFQGTSGLDENGVFTFFPVRDIAVVNTGRIGSADTSLGGIEIQFGSVLNAGDILADPLAISGPTTGVFTWGGAVHNTGTISGYFSAIFVQGFGEVGFEEGVSIVNDGDIVNCENGIGAVTASFDVTNTGVISLLPGTSTGIGIQSLFARTATVVNSGEITAGQVASHTGFHDTLEDPVGAVMVTNTGTMTGVTGGITTSYANTTIANEGTITTADGAAILFRYDPLYQATGLTLDNSGRIEGQSGTAISIEAEEGGDPGTVLGADITNTGEIIGDVTLSEAGDTFDGRGGSLAGMLFTEGGDDLVFAGESGATVAAGDGADGMLGGAGADFFDGGAGADTMVGRGGVNTLTGGAGADRFVITDRTEETTITDFETGIDVLDLSVFDATGALVLSRLSETADGVRLDLGPGEVLFDGLTFADLDPGDVLL
ncbi:MAG: hypothetical protein AAGA32_20560 [Pseudomonadota bacterium]